MEKEIANWYKDGFGTDFYHSLCQEGNLREAELFLKHLTTYLNLSENSTILDLGCGKGWHTPVPVDMGYRVEYLDICGNTTLFPKKIVPESPGSGNLGGMHPVAGTYDAVFSLYSSIGSLENDSDLLEVLTVMKQGLNASGLGVIDFMNLSRKQDQPARDRDTNGDTGFGTEDHEENRPISKNIRMEQENTTHLFTEGVRALNLSDFERLFEQAGIYLLDIFGDYKLNTYHPSSSPRLVMIFK